MAPKKKPVKNRKLCPECRGTGTVNAEPPLKGRKKCPTCNGKQWVEA